MDAPRVGFITPVFNRLHLTRACLEQRAEMLAALPFEAQAFVVGDDESLDVARGLGMVPIERDNRHGVGAKFNAGYRAAIREWGATHVMPIGSDSWLHNDVFDEAEWDERGGIAMIGLSSIAPWGDERLDLNIKYPAGFGVGMVYPAWAIESGGGATPHIYRGIDTSTWSRCGRGKVQLAFLEPKPQGYVNFHSPDTQITDYASVRATHSKWGKTREPWGDLRARYGDANVEKVMAVYALASLGVFLTGKRPGPIEEKLNRNLPGHKGRKRRSRPVKGIPYGANAMAEKRRLNMIDNFEDALGQTP